MKNELLTDYIDCIYRAALAKTRNSDSAGELAQETLTAAWISLSGGTEPDNLRAWLLRILANKFNNSLREKYRCSYMTCDITEMEIAGENEIEEIFADEEKREQLESMRRELAYLGKLHREVILRHYMRGQSITRIAADLQIPEGTVKSRLSTGRRYLREGVTDMENTRKYTKQSYDPDTLGISCSGGTGIHDEPFSLVRWDDRLTQSVLLTAYDKPVSEVEIAGMLGVPVIFIEPVVEKLVQGELMVRCENEKVYTDFIIYTERDRKSNHKLQLDSVDANFDLFWKGCEDSLALLREQSCYRNLNEDVKPNLELFWLIDMLTTVNNAVRDEITGVMPYSEYPYRRDGGRWFAMGERYAPDYDSKQDAGFWRYAINGEFGVDVSNYLDYKHMGFRSYGSDFGHYPSQCINQATVQWFCELLNELPADKSSAPSHILEQIPALIESGILKREGEHLRSAVPVVTHEEYHTLKRLASDFGKTLVPTLRPILLPLYESGEVKLPSHLKSVPTWQRYMFCSGSLVMAVLLKAEEKGLLLKDIKRPHPATLFVIEK
ncbi:MAG: RNA polymerase sigma factor [Clostridia bacterium]|nr:RNA polymerase sigma factor [Clostridia bacterium]